MRKFRVKVDLQKHSEHHKTSTGQKNEENEEISDEVIGLHRELEVLANDPDDAKIRAKHLLADEGYDEKLLHHATWTVTRLDRQLNTRN